MARTRSRTPAVVVARPRSDVYVGMLALAALATAVGCGLLALELGEYDWQTAATKGPALTAVVDTGPKPPAADAPKQ